MFYNLKRTCSQCRHFNEVYVRSLLGYQYLKGSSYFSCTRSTSKEKGDFQASWRRLTAESEITSLNPNTSEKAALELQYLHEAPLALIEELQKTKLLF